ncbi:MAG: hypothetical protein GXP32_03290, partial [Kiritimatiellaeota bacterium]|nr:hypothetical protein [Kiritimatiellota bacterium]
NEEVFAKFAATASLQRNMQALGAFVFLAHVKRRPAYERFIEPGAAVLLESLKEFNDLFPENTMEATESLLSNITRNKRTGKVSGCVAGCK